jgi:hypothetical protein
MGGCSGDGRASRCARARPQRVRAGQAPRPHRALTSLPSSISCAPQATEALRITAPELVKFGIMDSIVPEPLGGAHANPTAAFPAIRDHLLATFREYEHLSETEIRLDR